MIWVTLNMPSVAEECCELSGKFQGISHCLESGLRGRCVVDCIIRRHGLNWQTWRGSLMSWRKRTSVYVTNFTLQRRNIRYSALTRYQYIGCKSVHEYDTIRYDTVYLTCSKKLTCSQLSLPHRKWFWKVMENHFWCSVLTLYQVRDTRYKSVG